MICLTDGWGVHCDLHVTARLNHAQWFTSWKHLGQLPGLEWRRIETCKVCEFTCGAARWFKCHLTTNILNIAHSITARTHDTIMLINVHYHEAKYHSSQKIKWQQIDYNLRCKFNIIFLYGEPNLCLISHAVLTARWWSQWFRVNSHSNRGRQVAAANTALCMHCLRVMW